MLNTVSNSRQRSTKAKFGKRKVNVRKRTNVNKKIPFWIWVSVIAGVMAFAVFLTSLPDEKTTGSNQQGVEPDVVSHGADQIQNSQVRFDFYKILREYNVEVDAETITPDTQAAQVEFWLQAASFRKQQDADQLRVQLILLNLEASVEAYTTKRQDTWHRVFVGPFRSRSKLAKARAMLASHNLYALVIKRKAASPETP